MTASRILLYFCLSFIAGILLNSTIFVPQPLMLGILLLGIILILFSLKNKKTAVIGFCLFFLAAGIFRHQLAEYNVANSPLIKLNDKELDVNLIGVVVAEPDPRERSTKLTIDNLIAKTEAGFLPIRGKILVTTGKYPEYRYGDKVEISGRLESPPIFDEFNYKDYLKKDGIYSVIYFPKIELIGKSKGNSLMKIIFSFKDKFKTSCQSFISLPQEGILEALIFGDEENIPKELKDELNLTGTRHITAVSGMNITIVGFLILAFALSLGFWRQQAFYLSLSILFIYILMVGAPASAIRAGIMAGILMTAQYFGRLSSAERAVVFAATLMLFFNPFLLRLDVGFQLSFLAILGLVYFQPLFSEFFKKIPNPKIFPIRTTLSATMSAQIFTLPLLIYNFGRMPLLSPITNVLIVPFLAPLTVLILVFGLSAIFLRPLAFFLFFPTWLSLTYIVKVVDISAKIPFISLTFENIHWIWLLISYVVLSYFAFKAQERLKRPIFLR